MVLKKEDMSCGSALNWKINWCPYNKRQHCTEDVSGEFEMQLKNSLCSRTLIKGFQGHPWNEMYISTVLSRLNKYIWMCLFVVTQVSLHALLTPQSGLWWWKCSSDQILIYKMVVVVNSLLMRVQKTKVFVHRVIRILCWGSNPWSLQPIVQNTLCFKTNIGFSTSAVTTRASQCNDYWLRSKDHYWAASSGQVFNNSRLMS